MRVLIAAGGTAGHINPALAIAAKLKEKDPSCEVHFAGRTQGMEAGLVKKAGYSFHHIEVNGIQRKLTPKNIWRNMKALFWLGLSPMRAGSILNEVKPDLVIGAGGYVSGPVVRAAAKKGIKTAIHEQNAFPGVTNKLLAKQADLIMAAVPAAKERLGFPEKTVVVGNPVRDAVLHAGRCAARRKLNLPQDALVLLSFGGSLGARRINEVVADLAAWHLEKRNFWHLHATGQYGVTLFQSLSQEKGFADKERLIVKEYIDDMPACLAAADLCICRSGALTLAELAAVGRASILIPSPNVAENHQYYNALELQKAGAARVIEEKDLTGAGLIELVDELTREPELLKKMGTAALACAEPDSAEKIYQALRPFLKK